MKKNTFIKFLIPSKDIFHTFISNLILLGLTLWLGYLTIPAILQENDYKRLKEQNFIEKRNEFLKDFTYFGQSRIYSAERYCKNVKGKEGGKILSESWDGYMESVIAWNNTNLLNPIFIAYYFNNSAKDDYYNKLVKKLVDLHEKLIEIRDGKIELEIECIDLVEPAKNELFSFSEKLFFNGY